MKACQQLQQLFCSRENQPASRFIQQNEKLHQIMLGVDLQMKEDWGDDCGM